MEQTFNLDFFNTIAGLAAFILVAEEWIDRVWNLDGIASQVRTWFVGAILGNVGAYFKIGLFVDLLLGGQAWYVVGSVVGILCAIGGNVIFQTPAVKAILEALKIRAK